MRSAERHQPATVARDISVLAAACGSGSPGASRCLMTPCASRSTCRWRCGFSPTASPGVYAAAASRCSKSLPTVPRKLFRSPLCGRSRFRLVAKKPNAVMVSTALKALGRLAILGSHDDRRCREKHARADPKTPPRRPFRRLVSIAAKVSLNRSSSSARRPRFWTVSLHSLILSKCRRSLCYESETGCTRSFQGHRPHSCWTR